MPIVEGAGHPAGFLDRYLGPRRVWVIGRRSDNGVGLRKTRFQHGRIWLRVKLGHPAVNGPGRPRGAEYLRPVTFHLAISLRDQGRTCGQKRAQTCERQGPLPANTKPSTARRLAGPATAGRARESTRTVRTERACPFAFDDSLFGGAAFTRIFAFSTMTCFRGHSVVVLW